MVICIQKDGSCKKRIINLMQYTDYSIDQSDWLQQTKLACKCTGSEWGSKDTWVLQLSTYYLALNL